MYTTAGVDFSTTSAIKLYLYRGLSGLKGDAHWADGRMSSRHCLDIETLLSFAFSSFWMSRSATPQSPKPTNTDLTRGELLLSRPLFLSQSTEGSLSRLVCPSAPLWWHVTTEGKRLTVLSVKELSPRRWHRVCVLSAERKHLLRGVAAMLYHFCNTDSGAFRQLNNLYPNIFMGRTVHKNPNTVQILPLNFTVILTRHNQPTAK